MKKKLLNYILSAGLIGLLLLTGAVISAENGTNTDSGAPVTSDQTNAEPELYFAKLTLPKTRLYIGERVPLTLRLYVGEIRVDEITPPVLEQPEFSFAPVSQNSQVKTEINGNPYRMIQFNSALIPLKAGKLSIDPVTVDCIVVQTVPVALPSGETGYRIIRRTLEVKTPKLTVNVLPLPQKNRPADFSGGIGKLRLALDPASAVIRQGDSLTVKLTVSGTGNFSNIGPPSLEGANGLKVFPPQKTGELRPGRVVFEQVLIPLDEKLKKIGPFQLVYFDPDTGKYREAVATLPVNIKPNPEFQKQQAVANPGEIMKPVPEPAALKESPGDLRPEENLLVNQLWFWLLQIIPLVAFLAALYYRNYQRMLQSDSSQARAIKAARKSAARLAAAQVLLDRGDSEQLLEELHLILREYLGERFNLPVAGMTETVVETIKKIAPDVEPDTLTQIRAFFNGYDARRFTGTKLPAEEAAGLWGEVNTIVASLNRYPGAPVKGEFRSGNPGLRTEKE